MTKQRNYREYDSDDSENIQLPISQKRSSKRRTDRATLAVSRDKLSTRNGRGRNGPCLALIEEECMVLLEKMCKASESDQVSFNEGSPALEKIKLLSTVEATWRRRYHRKCLLENNILSVFAKWIEMPAERQYVGIQTREAVISMVDDVVVNDELMGHLKRSDGFGKILNQLSVQNDVEKNRMEAEKLVEKWKRWLFTNSRFEDDTDEDLTPKSGEKLNDALFIGKVPKYIDDTVKEGRKSRTARKKPTRSLAKKLKKLRHKKGWDSLNRA